MKLEKIPIQLAEPDPDVPELEYYYYIYMADLASLEKSIAEVGQLMPVLAYKRGDRYYVYVGLKRYFAIKRLYEKFGKPDYILALVDEEEPDRETKEKRRHEENSKKNRLPLNTYDKLMLALFRRGIAEQFVRYGEISKHFMASALGLVGVVEIEDLKRWYEIEMKVSGEVRLNIKHIKMVAQLAPENRDFAVLVLSITRTPAERIRDLDDFLLKVKIDKKVLEEAGVKNSYEEPGGEVKSQA